jgi:hypothetical protein
MITYYALSRLGGYHGPGQRRLPFLHQVPLQSVVSGDAFFLDGFTMSFRPCPCAKIGDGQAAQHQGCQPYTHKPSAHRILPVSLLISVCQPVRHHRNNGRKGNIIL